MASMKDWNGCLRSSKNNHLLCSTYTTQSLPLHSTRRVVLQGVEISFPKKSTGNCPHPQLLLAQEYRPVVGIYFSHQVVGFI
ncbi:hypothetical protein LDENG_00123760 [Lucifuga dentata]|nr:hypothetical protein LDENG_00123760 [Lucifuga dentata]